MCHLARRPLPPNAPGEEAAAALKEDDDVEEERFLREVIVPLYHTLSENLTSTRFPTPGLQRYNIAMVDGRRGGVGGGGGWVRVWVTGGVDGWVGGWVGEAKAGGAYTVKEAGIANVLYNVQHCVPFCITIVIRTVVYSV